MPSSALPIIRIINLQHNRLVTHTMCTQNPLVYLRAWVSHNDYAATTSSCLLSLLFSFFFKFYWRERKISKNTSLPFHVDVQRQRGVCDRVSH